MPDFKLHLGSLRFWLTLSAAAAFTIGAIRASAAFPAVKIISPVASQAITANQVTVNLSVQSFQLVDWQTHPQVKVGQGHIHLWLDQTTPTPASAIKTTSKMYTFDHVKPGSHLLRVELVNNDHSFLSPKATATVSFTTQAPAYAARQSSVLMISIVAFLLVVAALLLVSRQVKTKPHSGKSSARLAHKSARRK